MSFESIKSTIEIQDNFGLREVGITHPDNPSFVKVSDTGDVQISCGAGLGIILHPRNKSITFLADSVKFLTKEEDGFRWNKLSFNPQATKYTEPAFVSYHEDEYQNVYRGASDFLE